MAKNNGLLLYRGPSVLNGAPIAVIATGLAHKSANPKTGDEVQTYIIADNGESPMQAARSGAYRSVCGDCKHGPGELGSCYVTLVHGPRSVWDGLRRGIYPVARGWDDIASAGRGRIIRLGTYGDPMAVPGLVWETLLAESAGHTGYTHQWRNDTLDARQKSKIIRLTMASVDTPEEASDARARGLRFFRVRCATDPVLEREIICPASKEGDYRRTCATCLACNGGAGTRASVAIIAHGATAKRFTLAEVR